MIVWNVFYVDLLVLYLLELIEWYNVVYLMVDQVFSFISQVDSVVVFVKVVIMFDLL